MKTKLDIKRLSITAMLCAIAYAAVFAGKLVPNVAGFLSYDPKDAIVVIAGFIYGPVTSVVVSVVVSLIEMITVSATGPIGFVMNVLSTCAFALPASLIYSRFRNIKGAFSGLVAGVVCMTGCMLLWNWLITPLYMGVPRTVVVGMLIPTFLPFNLLKGGINLALTLVLYKPVVTALRSARLIPASNGEKLPAAARVVGTVFAVLLLAVLVLLLLFLAGVKN